MSILRHPLTLVLLASVSCWLAYVIGAQSESKKRTLIFGDPPQKVSIHPQATEQARTLFFNNRFTDARTPTEFQDALESILFQADKSEKNRLLAQLFARWLEESPLDALAQVRRVENLRYDILRTSTVFQRWAESDPAAALVLLETALDGRQNDPAASAPFLDGVDPPEYLLSIFAGLSRTSPEQTAALLTRLPDSPVTTHAFELLMQNWFPDDPAKIYEWTTTLEPSPFQENALKFTGTKAGQLDDPAEGIAWAQALPTPADQQMALAALTDQWSQRHANDAIQWINQLPESELKFALAPEVISSLTKVDPGAAADWLNQYEASPSMDSSVAAYALALSAANPAAAIGSASAITDQGVSERVMLKIAREWESNAPDSFQLFLEKTEGLPGSLRNLSR